LTTSTSSSSGTTAASNGSAATAATPSPSATHKATHHCQNMKNGQGMQGAPASNSTGS
jgi:hypothetical protein